jgi:energy-coupling factor transporter ATP-binding protein EcfA2
VTVNRVHIKNFKSIVDLSLELAPVNVFIGENGSGKSNILEALAFAAAAAASKLDNEFLASRGIRVTEPCFMRSAFAEVSEGAVSIAVENERGIHAAFEINTSEEAAYPKWQSIPKVDVIREAAMVLANNQGKLGELIADADKQLAQTKIELRRRVPELRSIHQGNPWRHSTELLAMGDFAIVGEGVTDREALRGGRDQCRVREVPSRARWMRLGAAGKLAERWWDAVPGARGEAEDLEPEGQRDVDRGGHEVHVGR